MKNNSDPARWRTVTSSKERRKGEVFLLRDDRFVLKIYKDGVSDPKEFGHYLARQLNAIEERRASGAP